MLTALGRIIELQQPDEFEPDKYMVSPNADPAISKLQLYCITPFRNKHLNYSAQNRFLFLYS